jgi:hypothetical protein
MSVSNIDFRRGDNRRRPDHPALRRHRRGRPTCATTASRWWWTSATPRSRRPCAAAWT